MTEITPVAVGTEANDGTGDSLRAAFIKVNAGMVALSAGKAEAAELAVLAAAVADLAELTALKAEAAELEALGAALAELGGRGRYRGTVAPGDVSAQFSAYVNAGDWWAVTGSGALTWTVGLIDYTLAVSENDVAYARAAGIGLHNTGIGHNLGHTKTARNSVLLTHEAPTFLAADGTDPDRWQTSAGGIAPGSDQVSLNGVRQSATEDYELMTDSVGKVCIVFTGAAVLDGVDWVYIAYRLTL